MLQSASLPCAKLLLCKRNGKCGSPHRNLGLSPVILGAAEARYGSLVRAGRILLVYVDICAASSNLVPESDTCIWFAAGVRVPRQPPIPGGKHGARHHRDEGFQGRLPQGTAYDRLSPHCYMSPDGF